MIDAANQSPLFLAYMGDAVMELLTREKLLSEGVGNLDKLNRGAKNYITAVSQSRASEIAEGIFSEKEADVFRRGKNAKTSNVPKSAKVAEYHRATGLEAVFGYLYLSGNMERARELFANIYPGEEFSER